MTTTFLEETQRDQIAPKPIQEGGASYSISPFHLPRYFQMNFSSQGLGIIIGYTDPEEPGKGIPFPGKIDQILSPGKRSGRILALDFIAKEEQEIDLEAIANGIRELAAKIPISGKRFNYETVANLLDLISTKDWLKKAMLKRGKDKQDEDCQSLND